MKKQAVVKEPEETVEIFNCEQGSDEWAALRLGIPTASSFGKIMATGKDGDESRGRAEYMRKLAGEIITGEPMENFSNSYMQRGVTMEPEAREHYAFTRGVDLTPIGFVRRKLICHTHERFVGCSPDSFIGDDRVLEIKTMAPHLLIDLAAGARPPAKHQAQCQGSLWVTGRSVCELLVFYSGMPSLIFKWERNEAYIRQLADEVGKFDWELRALVEKIRNIEKR